MRILERERPGRLYHYTTTAGLLGIIQQKEIWATHSQYLNDLREFRHALEIAQEELRAMRAASQDADRSCTLQQMEENTTGIEIANVCVTSFSENRDSLSQWRAYSGGGAGFAIGFSSEFLNAVLDTDCALMPCIYDEDEQRGVVRSMLERVMDGQEGGVKDEDEGVTTSRAGSKLNAHLLFYAAMLKHQSFKDEKEWRISGLFDCAGDRFGYRPGRSMLIPYYRISLDVDHEPFRIEEVIVGPTPYPEQSSRSIKSLLVTCGFQDVHVVPSTVPYRNW